MQTPSHDDERENPYADLSPFELKEELLRFAKDYTHDKTATNKLLNAGRGNPNWLATTPRDAFFLLGQFALEESRRVWEEPDLGGMPNALGCVGRLRRYLDRAPRAAGSELLRRAVDYGVAELGFEPDAFVHELVDSILGDNYPYPDRMLVHTEVVVRRYLERTMLGDRPPAGEFKVFAVEGATAAMCYVFKSLMTNRLLKKGDTIALGTPIFTPYIEMPHLPEFALQTVEIRQSEMVDGRHTWQYPPEEIRKLEDPAIKAFFLVNPSNPASYAMRDDTYAQIVELVRTKRPDLIILTDDVYGTFAEGFRSLAAELPHNTILVYSYSKLFGCTGVRLGVVALHDDNVIDRAIAALPASDREVLDQRYSSLVQDPGALRFIDRMVADSRDVALNHTAGLSLPQQVQMALFSLFVLLDADDRYTKRCREILHERLERLLTGLGLAVPDDPLRCGYYVDIDLEAWARKAGGEEFMRYVETHREPLDVVIGLAREYGMVLLNGSGFAGPTWSVRVSLANLDADDYATIGRNLAHVMSRAIDRWRDSRDGDRSESQASYARDLGAQGASPR